MGKRRKEIPEFLPLTEMMAAYGFVNMTVSRNKFREHIYRKGNLYLRISISFDFRDFPFYCCVGLGEGSSDWPDTDWNSAALWRLVKTKTPDHYPDGIVPYGLKSEDDIADVILDVRDDLRQFAQDFLSGDLGLFKRIRSEQNQERQGYQIHRLGPDGKYHTEIEQESEMLKERYSKSE